MPKADEPRAEGCTCPPLVDVMRGRAGDTREPCPVHPEPDLSGITFLPRIEGPYDFKPFQLDDDDAQS